MWPTPIISTKVVTENFLPPVFDNYPIAPPLGDIVQPEGWQVSTGVQDVLPREMVDPRQKEIIQEAQYNLCSTKRAKNVADDRSHILTAHILTAHILVDGTSAEMVPYNMQLDATELLPQVPSIRKTPAPTVPPVAVRRLTPTWIRAQQR